ncbi:MAG: GNAT family N-acetyltransferase [Proteobacteria bacterium]|nr:GNAT family N-acetyltransferase [Pseudomonadota bacterium]MBU1139369.1 GNAT family N-acetyltransferase [Pseudomonadota bacterium]MBU1234953.1 GNAT family N-acetyltransferase [Pseudomonadota bacterium]MBU1418169.1 GNAT family N-acetyltransferase [Pseudomonadota bacterium]MBU1456726.1 GNAT family N-acetyltransferase [Pseudomonadota bacterium]
MQNKTKFSFRFLSARTCRAEILASVYAEDEKLHQLNRLQSLLQNSSAERLYFVLARHKNEPVALLQLCRERKKQCCFRIRGLYTHHRFRNRSLATRLLQLACKCVSEFQEGEEILSFILPTNLPSLAAHGHAGFFPATRQGLQPERHLCLAWTR